MHRASDLFGLPVITRKDRELGTVREILVDLARARLGALVMPVKILADPVLIPLDKVQDMGPDAVRLLGEDASLDTEELEKFRQGKLTLERVRSLTVVTDAGDVLGNVEDLILEEDRVVALELSGGLIQDIFQGRENVPVFNRLEIRDDEIIVPQGTKCLSQDNIAPEIGHHQGL